MNFTSSQQTRLTLPACRRTLFFVCVGEFDKKEPVRPSSKSVTSHIADGSLCRGKMAEWNGHAGWTRKQCNRDVRLLIQWPKPLSFRPS